MDNKLKEFIQKNIKLIDENEFERLYEAIYDPTAKSALTQVLMSSGINPLDHMSYVPERFSDSSSITEIEIPNCIKRIRVSAFAACSKLETISIPSSVKRIESSAFYACKSLKTVDLEEGLEWIGAGSFQFCSLLPTIKIPSSVVGIGYHAFSSCFALKDVVYNGTQKQWKKMIGDEDWCSDSEHLIVHCTDGNIKA